MIPCSRFWSNLEFVNIDPFWILIQFLYAFYLWISIQCWNLIHIWIYDFWLIFEYDQFLVMSLIHSVNLDTFLDFDPFLKFDPMGYVGFRFFVHFWTFKWQRISGQNKYIWLNVITDLTFFSHTNQSYLSGETT